MITVHHLEHSRSQRILWLLEELGTPYEIARYARDPKTMLAPKSLLAVHPLGKSPVVTDGTRVIAESALIIEYLIEQAGDNALAPPTDPDARLAYRYWMHYGEGSLMPLLVMKLLFGTIAKKAPFVIRPIAKAIDGQVGKMYLNHTLDQHIKLLADALSGRDWLVENRLTGADILMSFPVEALCARGGDRVPQALHDYVARIKARPAFATALERGGPYAVMG